MPPVSEKQRRAMYAAAEGKSRLGIPKKVGEEFVGRQDMAQETLLSAALRKAIADGLTELDIAKAIRDGRLSSPQRYENVWLFEVRITGTGTAYRSGLDEYVYRPPENFLTEEFVQRCNGLPLIFEHPKDSILTTEEYRDRAIGTIILPYIKGDEVWGIAKVFDDDAAQLMCTSYASTSPAVVFRDAGSTETVHLKDGSTVLIEGKPSYLDHLAICKEGVWDKGGQPTGVNNAGDSTVENEEKVPAWADALCKRMDEVHARLDAFENKGEVADSKDAEEGHEHLGFKGLEKKVEGEGYDKEAAENIAGKVAQEKKADAEKGSEHDGEKEERDENKAVKEIKEAEKEGEKERKAEERADAQGKKIADLEAKLAAVTSQLGAVTKPLSVEERDGLAQAQARADSIASAFGDSVRPPLHGESPIQYRKALASKFQKHSASLKGVKLDALDADSFGVIEDRIYADAQAAARTPSNLPAGRLMERKYTDASGRQITEYTGDSAAAWAPFMAPGVVARINRTFH
jgi:hypothetical protein